MTLIYTKTQKGHDEVGARTGGLTPRVRRLLIFIDGKRTNEQLQAMVGDASVAESIELLRASGYIEELSGAAPAAAEAVAAVAQATPIAAATAAPSSTAVDPRVLDVAHKLMLNSLSDYTGPLKYRALMQRIREESTINGLKQLTEEWYEAVNDNPAASFAVDELKHQILDTLNGHPHH
ncbi:MAG: hypothetical protein HYS20_14365 [Rhodocyclales bacterium]|nr:hypothetical protein [Rhodocyclales bacterium]